MKKAMLVCMLLMLSAGVCAAEVKKAELAGQWYAASKEALGVELRSYLEKAALPSVDGKIIAIISPHAGFQYSGPVAAYGFKAIEGRDIKTVVVIGFSHRRFYDGIAVLDVEGFETPLGALQIDREMTKKLMEKNQKIYNYPIAFFGENSIEMQIPFLQVALKDFNAVLIAIGNQSLENCRVLGDALYETLKDKEKFLLIASTDMSHYLSYKEACELDRKTISLIEKFDPEGFYDGNLKEGNRLMCGYGAVCATMLAAKKLGADNVKILRYANSGDTAGGKDSVVGYVSALMVKSQIPNKGIASDLTSSMSSPRNDGVETLAHNDESAPRNDIIDGEKNMLNEEQRKKMLKLARESIMYYLQEGKRLPVTENDPTLNKEMGAFVTLRKNGELRGCIGNMVGKGPFYLTVRDMAVEAATGDPRFRAVTSGEMKDINIEISALSPLEKIKDPGKIVAGKHGVLVRKGSISGVYLPQVATEEGWDREEFMNSLCGRKAGMAPDAWKKGECEIYIFTAEVFGEKN